MAVSTKANHWANGRAGTEVWDSKTWAGQSCAGKPMTPRPKSGLWQGQEVPRYLVTPESQKDSVTKRHQEAVVYA